jgi:hypothetical protein
MLANHKKGMIMVRGIPIEIDRGQIGWSEETLAERWKWSRGKVRRYLDFLEKTGQQIVQQKSRVKSLISIVNYDRYQFNDTTNDTTDSTTNGHQTVQQTDTNKNDKNVKNDKKVFIRPSIEEIEAYCLERGNAVLPEKWLSHYESNGWMVGKNKMKDWKAAVRTWEKPKEPKRKQTSEEIAAQKRLEERMAAIKQAELDHLKVLKCI